MKRDWYLIREILACSEQGYDPIKRELAMLNIRVPQPILGATLYTLKDHGYLKTYDYILDGKYWLGDLTWKGHDLLEYLGNGITIDELEDMDIPITEHTLKKYAEFLLEKELFEEVEIDD